MARSKGTMKVSANIEPRIGAPLDARMVVSTLADLTTSGNFPYPYVGMLVAVQATNKLYMYNGGTITSSSAWDEVGGSSLSGTVGSATQPVYLNAGTITETMYSVEASVPSDAVFTDTTYESKTAASGGIDVSLVTTGEKYSWNNKSNLQLGSTASTAAAGNHTHTATLATESGSTSVTLESDGKYKLTAGGNSVTFSMPNIPTYENKTAASGGTDLSLVTTGDKYNWDNKTSLTIGTTSSTAAAGNHNHDGTYLKSVPEATTSAYGGFKTGFTTSGNNRAVQLDANGKAYVEQKDTTYESKSATSGGTDLSLVTTGEKYTWNNKSSLTIGTTSTTAAAGNHNHDGTYLKSVPEATTSAYGGFKTGYTTDGNNRAVEIDENGKAYVTQKDTTYESKTAASGGTDLSLVTTGEKYTWNNKSNLTIGTTSTTAAAGDHAHGNITNAGAVTTTATIASGDKIAIIDSSASSKVTGSGISFDGSTATKCLTQKGTWETFGTSNLTIGTTSSTAAAGNHTHSNYIATSAKGANGGVAELDSNGKVPASQLPAFVDDVVEYTSTSDFPAEGASGVIYVETSTNKTYRWSGTEYVVIGNSLALGETSSTAYRGDRGKTAYNHSQSTHAPTTSSAAASGGTTLSLVTTGEKYTWNNKSDLALGTSATTAAKGNHTHTASLATDTGTSAITLAGDGKYKLTAGGSSVIFTMPTIPTYSSQAAASGGTDLSLVTTGEKYTWNNKSNLSIGTTSSTAAAGNHTHTATLATDTGTSSITLASAGKYKLTAGGSSVIFTMPTSTNLSIGTTSTTAAAGNHTHTATLATDTGTSSITLASAGKYKLTAGGSSVIFTMPTSTNLSIGTTSTTAAAGNHTHTTTLASDTGTATVTLSANSTYKLTAGGNAVIFKTPADTTYSSKSAASGGTDLSLVTTGEKYTWNNKSSLALGETSSTAYRGDRGATAYNHSQATHAPTTSSAAASGGTTLSLVTTGEKYTWNNKSNLTIGTTSTTAAAGDHTHSTYASKSGDTITGTLILSRTQDASGTANNKPALIVGGTDTQAHIEIDNNEIIAKSNGTTSTTLYLQDGNGVLGLCGSDYSVTNPDKFRTAIGAGTSSLSIGSTASTAAAGNHTHTTSIATSSATNQITLAASTKYAITAGGTSYVFTTPPNTTYSGATGSQLGLIRISASGDVLSIYTSAS